MDRDTRELARTPEERAFLDQLLAELPDLMVWPHVDGPDDTPWLCVSTDFVEDGAVNDTLRLDFDGIAIAGGFSPAFLNWDDGVRARDAGIDLQPPDGLELAGEEPVELARAAAAWFRYHLSSWPTSSRRARWHGRSPARESE